MALIRASANFLKIMSYLSNKMYTHHHVAVTSQTSTKPYLGGLNVRSVFVLWLPVKKEQDNSIKLNCNTNRLSKSYCRDNFKQTTNLIALI